MGFFYRKSVNFGPFRVNLSRSGVGYSVGGRDKTSADWGRLQELVRRAMPSVLETLRNSNEDILLTDAGLFARYDRMNEIDALRNDTGTQSGPHSLWLVVPGHGSSTSPTLCGEAVPITNEAQFEQLTPQWARIAPMINDTGGIKSLRQDS